MSDNYTVYKHTSPEGKVYIGCTGEEPEERWKKRYCHNPELTNDVERFGWRNFDHDIVASGLSEDDAYNLEKELISKYKAENPDCLYNKAAGGKYNTGYSFNHTEEAKRKIKETSTGRRHTEETKRKLSESRRGEGNPMYGKFGKDNPSYGLHRSDETKRKLSEARRGEKHPMYGKHHSEETKRKMTEAHIGKQVSEITRQKIKDANSKKVICVETGEIYNSMCEAYLNTGIPVSSISAACNKQRKTTHGQHWKFV